MKTTEHIREIAGGYIDGIEEACERIGDFAAWVVGGLVEILLHIVIMVTLPVWYPV